jgi:glutamyl/glutaminyl-tRNA synthetase
VARAVDGHVVLRIEDHDRGRSRAAFERAIIDDLERLGLFPDEPDLAQLRRGPSGYRQSDVPERYAAALERLAARVPVYRCACSRTTFARWAAGHGRPWTGPGCPGACLERPPGEVDATGLRAAVGSGIETWDDLLAGPCGGDPSAGGDPLLRERAGWWTYAWCVVVDDLEQGIDLVIRGADLLDATPVQLRLARLLVGSHPARFLHHPLVRRADGTKLSKADGATAVREALDAGIPAASLLARAARAAGLRDVPGSLEPDALGPLVRASAGVGRGAGGVVPIHFRG